MDDTVKLLQETAARKGYKWLKIDKEFEVRNVTP